MFKHLAYTKKFCIGLPIVILSLLSCAPMQDQSPVISELLYPAEVPAAFDTVLISRATNSGNNRLQLKWSSENGTIRGEGESITWNAPAVYGTYKICVEAINAAGLETISQASIDVVPFYRTQIDPDPEINLRLPVFGNSMVGEQSLVRPLTNAEISCDVPFPDITNYKYEWYCNGGKTLGAGLKDGTAAKIGWISPGVPGNYTVTVMARDSWGNITVGCVYFQVKNPDCCGQQDTGELYRWKE